MAEKQQVSWVDMVVANPKPLAEFYAAVIGYTLDPCDDGNGATSYSLIDGRSKEAFGICDKAAFPNFVPDANGSNLANRNFSIGTT